jgi:2-alkyl-3-oxoalkanoate reductase
MRVFIVGATGVLGRALLPLLLQRDYVVRALVRDRAQLPATAGVEAISGDLLDANIEPRLPAMLAGCDAAVHIATAIPSNPAAPGVWDTNTQLRTEGTHRLLDAALAAGVPRYIQQSITMAYPDGGDRWLDETIPLDTSPSRAAMVGPVIAMEGMIHQIPASQLRWCILRGGAFVGSDTAQDNLVAQLLAGQAVVPGDGRNFISPIHVSDMATAIALALARAPARASFNIVGTPLRYGDYIDSLADRLGVAHPQRNSKLPSPPSWRCSNQTACETLGWMPTHSIWPEPDPENTDASNN